MDIKLLISFIDDANKEAINFIDKYCSGEMDSDIDDVIFTLNLLKQELEHNPDNINVRVLRAMHDIGIFVAKELEQYELGEMIRKVTRYLRKEHPTYDNLKQLGMDFRKGDPI